MLLTLLRIYVINYCCNLSDTLIYHRLEFSREELSPSNTILKQQPPHASDRSCGQKCVRVCVKVQRGDCGGLLQQRNKVGLRYYPSPITAIIDVHRCSGVVGAVEVLCRSVRRGSYDHIVLQRVHQQIRHCIDHTVKVNAQHCSRAFEYEPIPREWCGLNCILTDLALRKSHTTTAPLLLPQSTLFCMGCTVRHE